MWMISFDLQGVDTDVSLTGWGDVGTYRLSKVTLQEGPEYKPENTSVLLEMCFPDQQ